MFLWYICLDLASDCCWYHKISLELFPLQFIGRAEKGLVLILLQKISSIYLWNYLVLGFAYWFHLQICLLLVCLGFLFLLESVLTGYMFLGIYPFLLCCSIWHVIAHNNTLYAYFCDICCSVSTFISDFIWKFFYLIKVRGF